MLSSDTLGEFIDLVDFLQLFSQGKQFLCAFLQTKPLSEKKNLL